MTMQASDSVWLEGEEYVLIDVERGKQMITRAAFGKVDPLASYCSTDCWRGYTADYFVKDSYLSVIRYPNTVWREGEDNDKTKEVSVNFTGSCIVAKDDGWCTDFIECYLGFDEALELYFKNGRLIERLSLKPAIEECRRIKETEEYKNKMMPEERNILLKNVALKHLKYHYGDKTYKWRKIWCAR